MLTGEGQYQDIQNQLQLKMIGKGTLSVLSKLTLPGTFSFSFGG